MTEQRYRLAVIVGSTREGRFADRIVAWFLDQATPRTDIELDLIDLAEVGLPAVHRSGPDPAVEEFNRRVEAADAFVVVTPEYNHGYPAAVKFALDSVGTGFRGKPVGFVSYGGVSGGLRAVEQLRLVFVELHAAPIRESVSFALAWNQFDDDGAHRQPETANAAAKALLDQLSWWALGLKEARARRPYGG
ncbi:MAG TPA: NAD(P)H-dependent oxidoreductase [Pilimelia sp.]|nr:NAD(P)H-dependent oxidoreductase [Pilimelia sp.]